MNKRLQNYNKLPRIKCFIKNKKHLSEKRRLQFLNDLIVRSFLFSVTVGAQFIKHMSHMRANATVCLFL